MNKVKICPKCGKTNDSMFLRCKYCTTDLEHVSVTYFSDGEDIKDFQEQSVTVANMPLTTGHTFDGYRIVKYCDVVFDEMFVGMGIFKKLFSGIDNYLASITGDEAVVVGERLNKVKESLRDRVKGKAAAMGANALIGVDFESSKVGELIMVSMVATAVKIEKIENE